MSKQDKLVENWNATNTIGTIVDVKDDIGDVVRTKTKSDAWNLCGTAAVLLEDRRGGYMLERCTVVKV